MDEYLDVVDEGDRVIGKKLRSQIYAEGLSNYRVINVFLANSEGRLWIPRRTADKRIFPLALDMSVGGHVESGSTYDETFKKEVLEEINLDTDNLEWSLLGYLIPMEDGVSSFMKVYEIKIDQAPSYNEKDFVEYFWLKPEELMGQIAQGEKVKADLPILVKKFYLEG